MSNVKLEYKHGHQLTKTNLQSTCVASIAGNIFEYPTLLLDERIFFSFLTEATGDEINITFDEKQIKLSDGKTEIYLNREDPTNFPKTPEEPEAEDQQISREYLAAIKIARSFINDSEAGGNFQFVHVNGEFIAGIHTHFFYLCNKFTDLPEIMLTSEQADLITNYDADMWFNKQDNHYFFSTPNAQYIFTRKEGKVPPLDSVLTRLLLPGTEFTIAKNDLISFCNVANIVTETPVALCRMEPAGFFAHLELNDSSYSRKTQREIPVTGSFEAFNFNSRLIINALKNIPYETLNSKTVQNCLIVTGSKEYFCFLGMAK